MQKLAEICVRRPVFATMLILSLTVVGIFSFNSLGVDLFPKIDLPTITVSVVNPGASPQEIETEITDKVEGAVNTISGIDELRSTSVEGVSQVFITFLLEKNADIAAQEVRNKVDLIVNDLPVTAEQPIVQKLDTDAAPVLRIAVSAPRSLREVTDIADKQIKQRIESISGVGQVEIIGQDGLTVSGARFAVDSHTMIVIGDHAGTFADLKVGQTVELKAMPRPELPPLAVGIHVEL